MFNLSPEKVLLVLVVALVVLGPNRLPQAARSLGRLMANLRQMSTTVQSEVRDALAEPRDAFSGAFGDMGFEELRDTVNGAVHPLRTAISPVTEALTPAEPVSSGGSPTVTPDAPRTQLTDPPAPAGPSGRERDGGPSGLERGAGPSGLSSAPLPPAPDDPTLN